MTTTGALYEIFRQHPSVRTDSRKLQKGDIYWALKGPSFDGNQFAQQALNAGAAAAVVDDPSMSGIKGCFLVPDGLKALQQLARHHRRQLDVPVIAITGSNGKTTTKELMTAVLRKKFVTYATAGNLNNHIGVPLTLLSAGIDADTVIVEMGANHQKEIEQYCAIAEPTHGLITNCGKAHIEGFGGVEGVRAGKGELYDYLRQNDGVIFRDDDQHYLKEMAAGTPRQVTYGTAESAWCRGVPARHRQYLECRLVKPFEAIVATHLVGTYNLPNVLAAIAAGLHFGVSIEECTGAIAAYNPDNSRSQWIRRGTNSIILDAYNANPTSMNAAIENFAQTDGNNKMIWLGGMKEMGADEEKEHRLLVALLDRFASDWDVILVGDEFDVAAGSYIHFATAAEAAASIRKTPPEHATILIKGSRGSRMELMLEALPGG